MKGLLTDKNFCFTKYYKHILKDFKNFNPDLKSLLIQKNGLIMYNQEVI